MKTKNNQSKRFWISYVLFVVIASLLTAILLSSCSTDKSLPADWRYHKTVASVHPKLKAHKIVHRNRE